MLINHENSQKIAERIGGILHRNVNIMDEEGRIVASTDPTRIGALHEAACKLIEQNIPEMDVYSIDQMTGSREGINLPLQIDGKTIGVIGVTGNPDELRDIGLVITEMAEILFSETLQTLRQQSISRQRRHFLEQLLFSTPTAPSESFERRGRALGVPLHHIRSVGVLSIDAELQDADTAAFYDTLLSILRNHLGDSILLNHLYLGKKLILFLGGRHSALPAGAAEQGPAGGAGGRVCFLLRHCGRLRKLYPAAPHLHPGRQSAGGGPFQQQPAGVRV